MNKKSVLLAVVATMTVAVIANASAIKTWTNEVLRYSDLNSNFAHIHDNMVGGHGARLVNADVSASASIAHSKMATPGVIPKAIAQVSAECTASPCTIAMQSPSSFFSGITRASAGVYTVTFTSARTNANYVAIVNSSLPSTLCQTDTYTTTTFVIGCRSFAGPGTADDANFSIAFFDDNN